MKGSNICLFITTLLSLIGYSWTYSISFRRPCHDLSPECLTKSLQAALPVIAKGIPELGVEPLDPYILKELTLDLPGGIEIKFRDGHGRGLRKCHVDFARLVDDEFESQFHCNLTIKGKYRSTGQLFTFPINGDGHSTIKCNNIKLHSILKLGSVTKSDGLRYLNIISSNIDHSFDGRVSYSMTNLFKGSPEISKALLNFMNANWKLVAEEFGTPIVEYGVQAVMKTVKRLFEVISIDELEKL